MAEIARTSSEDDMAKATEEDNVTPIRALDEEAALAWLRAQPGASTTLPAAELARRWGWQEHRVRRRLNAWQKAGLVRRRGRVVQAVGTAVVPTVNPTPNRTPIPTPVPTANPTPMSGVGNLIQHFDLAKDVEVAPTVGFGRSVAVTNAAQNAAEVTASDNDYVARLVRLDEHDQTPHPTPELTARPASRTAVDVAAYVAAVALVSAAAWFSIRGMVVIFPGSPVPVVVMAVAMEAAKLVTAGWLARRWRSTAWVWRAALVVFVFGLAVINATGVYAQLVSAHVGERGAAAAAVETQASSLDEKIIVQAHKVADLDRRLGQIDTTIEEAARRGRTKTALSAMDDQRKARGALADERNREAGSWWP
jgi:hypothetical protein